MNETTLRGANLLLEAIAGQLEVGGEAVEVSPTRIGASVGLASSLEVARAMRALIARGRVEGDDEGRYRLLDARPVSQDEPHTARRRRPARRQSRALLEVPSSAALAAGLPLGSQVPSYADVGRAVVERLLGLLGELSAMEVRAHKAEQLQDEYRERAAEADRLSKQEKARADKLALRVGELENNLEMSDNNLRQVLSAAGLKTTALGDPEAQAMLQFLGAGRH
ncbi:MAG: hypothetical protein WDA71_12810 [Actinomycetota bacterium]